jgi:hypothetical protein
MRDIDRLQACTLAPPKPFKSCFEILSDNPKAQTGVYTIEILVDDVMKLRVPIPVVVVTPPGQGQAPAPAQEG